MFQGLSRSHVKGRGTGLINAHGLCFVICVYVYVAVPEEHMGTPDIYKVNIDPCGI